MGGKFLNSLKWVFVMALLPTTTPINAFKVYTRIVKLVQNTSTKDYDTQVVSDMVPISMPGTTRMALRPISFLDLETRSSPRHQKPSL